MVFPVILWTDINAIKAGNQTNLLGYNILHRINSLMCIVTNLTILLGKDGKESWVTCIQKVFQKGWSEANFSIILQC